MQDSTARAISTVGIWLAVAIILTFGVFRMNWGDIVATMFMAIIVLIICAAAGIATAAVWGQLGAKHFGGDEPEKNQGT
jgi:hypothetical protein